MLTGCGMGATATVTVAEAGSEATASPAADAVAGPAVTLEENRGEYATCAAPEPVDGVEPILWSTADGDVEVVARSCFGEFRDVLGFTSPGGDLHLLQVDDLSGTTRFGSILGYRVMGDELEIDWWASTVSDPATADTGEYGPTVLERTGTATVSWVDGAPQVGDGSLPPEVVVDEVIYGPSGFVTPDGQIGCLVLSGSVDCSVHQPAYTPELVDEQFGEDYCQLHDLDRYAIRISELGPPPAWYCTDIYLHTYADIADGGRWARTEREWLESNDRTFAQLDYGRTYLHSNVECTSSLVDGDGEGVIEQVRCEQLVAGHWFEISREFSDHSS